MSKLSAQAKKQATISAVVTRADGRKFTLGVVSGGRWWQRALSYLRIKWFNRQQARRRAGG